MGGGGEATLEWCDGGAVVAMAAVRPPPSTGFRERDPQAGHEDSAYPALKAQREVAPEAELVLPGPVARRLGLHSELGAHDYLFRWLPALTLGDLARIRCERGSHESPGVALGERVVIEIQCPAGSREYPSDLVDLMDWLC